MQLLKSLLLFSSLLGLASWPGHVQETAGDSGQSDPSVACADLPRLTTAGSDSPSFEKLAAFCVEAARGEYLELRVRTCDSPLEISLMTAGGGLLAKFRAAEESTTFASGVAPEEGLLLVRLRPELEESGPYVVSFSGRRPARESDQLVIQIHKKLSDAEEARGEWSQAGFARALQAYRECLLSAQERGLSRLAARILARIGTLQSELTQNQDAIASLRQAANLFGQIGDREGELRVTAHLVVALVNSGDLPQALELVGSSLDAPGQKLAPDIEGSLLHARAFAFSSRGELMHALPIFEKATAKFRAARCRYGLASSLLDLGYVHTDSGRETEALPVFQEALLLWKELGNPRGQAQALLGIGMIYGKLGRKQETLEVLSRSRAIAEKLGARFLEAVSLNALGVIQQSLGRPEISLNYFRSALEVFRAQEHPFGCASTLLEVGRSLEALGEFTAALDAYQEALAFFQRLEDTRGEAILVWLIGSIHLKLDHSAKAMAYYNEALERIRQASDPFTEAEVLNDLGELHCRLGQYDSAANYIGQALDLNELGEYQHGKAVSLFSFARLERARGNLERALEFAEAGIAVVEAVRTDFPGQAYRSSYFASVQGRFEFMIDLLMLLHRRRPVAGFDVRAFGMSERARARSLIESLAEQRFAILRGADRELIQRERSLREKLNLAALRSQQTTQSSDTAKREIQELTLEYERVEALMRSRSPKYASLAQPEPLGLREIQEDLLDDSTVLLEYSLGEERSYLWVVEKSSHGSFELPPRETIEREAKRLRELLTARQPRAGETTADRMRRIQQSRREYWPLARKMSEMLLGAVVPRLDHKRLLIVSDGTLLFLPFGALASPHDGGADPPPLMVEHEIVQLPSASSLAALRREVQDRELPSRWLAALGDPVYEVDDPRLKDSAFLVSSLSAAKGNRRNFNAADESQRLSKGTFSRLPGTGHEIDTIASLFPESSVLKLTGFQADRSAIERANLADYKIIHFATHGRIDNKHPNLSGIVLSLWKPDGSEQDGFLRLHDIYNLNLPVELVVLSACDTALGKEVRGEGLIGLVRGFMYAGAPRVVASLWKADDEATRQLMERFYREMLIERKPPAAALRAAQLALWRQPEWRAPFYWAGFVLEGEWAPLSGMTGPRTSNQETPNGISQIRQAVRRSSS